jgi:hypothetical protein
VQAYVPIERGRNLKPTIADAQIVCISYFGASRNPVLVRYVIRRLRRLLPKARFVACFWLLGADLSKLEDWRNKVGADFVATSLKEAASICQHVAMGMSKIPFAVEGRARDEDAIEDRETPLRNLTHSTH